MKAPASFGALTGGSGYPTDCGEGNYTGGSGGAACTSSDLAGQAEFDTELRTNPIDLTGYQTVTLAYEANYGNYGFRDFLNLDISSDGGSNWTNLISWNEDHHPNGLRTAPGESVVYDLSAYGGQSGLLLRWHYYDPLAGDWGWYAQVDDIALTCAASDAIWDGGGLTNDWSEAANWVGDVVPGSSRSVLFNTTSTKDALIDSSFGGTVANLTVDSGYTGTITMNRAFTVTTDFNLTDGRFIVADPGTAVLRVGNLLSHTAGTMQQTQGVSGTDVAFLQIEDGSSNVKYRGADIDASGTGADLGNVTLSIRAVDLGHSLLYGYRGGLARLCRPLF